MDVRDQILSTTVILSPGEESLPSVSFKDNINTINHLITLLLHALLLLQLCRLNDHSPVLDFLD